MIKAKYKKRRCSTEKSMILINGLTDPKVNCKKYVGMVGIINNNQIPIIINIDFIETFSLNSVIK
jgi:hypothetical protein